MKIAIISCSARKLNFACSAKEMYSPSSTFSLSLEYAKKFADQIFILSAKYGLIDPNMEIVPYNLNLAALSKQERINWAERVIEELQKVSDIENDHFTLLAGKNYYQLLIQKINNYSLPLEHDSLGNRPGALRRLIEEFDAAEAKTSFQDENESSSMKLSKELHSLFAGARRFHASEINDIPFEDGIYLVFEKGEKYLGFDRIVRIGTHTSTGRLKQRLKDHFHVGNKDGSIFRKNIGKALLARRNDSYLESWTLDTSSEENRKFVDRQIQSRIEEEVTTYLQANLSFTVFSVKSKDERLRLEEAIISTLNVARDFGPSPSWLGNCSPEKEIRESGLWLKKGLRSDPLTFEEMQFIRNGISGGENMNLIRVASVPKKSRRENGDVHPHNFVLPIEKHNASTSDVRAFIAKELGLRRSEGAEFCILVAGDIHRAMGLRDRFPTVCSAMYQSMRDDDEVLFETPSKKSSTIRIKYYL